MSIKVSQLSKIYGKQKAVDNISFEVNKGGILGFLGPNGAGKSTTMKIATGFIPPSSGSIEIEGLDATLNSRETKGRIGYLPEHNPLYLDMYVKEFLQFSGEVQKLKKSYLKTRVDELIALCGLTKEQHKQIGQLSKGYRQRVGLAQALLHDPAVLILDEPTTGLDPNQLVEIRNLIKQISKDKTVILSTHIMQEVKALCNRVVIINNGQIVADDAVDALTQSTPVVEIEFKSAVDIKVLERFGAVTQNGAIYSIQQKNNKDIRSILFDLAKEKDWVILSLQQKDQDLEQVFRNLTQKSNVGDL